MGIQSISFKGWITKSPDSLQQEHERLNKVAQMYTTGSVQDDAFIKRAHDVVDITPWGCSEGAMIEKEDRAVSDKFFDTMVSNFQNGNKKLAYALGRMIELSRAGKANNGDFEDLKLGKIEDLRATIFDESYQRDPKTHAVTTPKPEYKEVKETMDQIIYHKNPF